MTKTEQITAIVYGDTFALYDEAAFDEFLEPLRRRLSANKIDSDAFRGKRCLDAGCGGGRGSILMAQAGAKEVVGVDLSPVNVESSRKRSEQKGLKNTRFEQHSLLQLPFPDASFDVVWCNGVLHHTDAPDRALQEITRVLKPGGSMWLYLYGSGGIYWYAIDWIRDILRDVDVRDCIHHLNLMDAPVRRIAEWIDDWFVPHLRRYTAEDVTARLEELGFHGARPLPFGTVYDTSQRRVMASEGEIALMGEGDLRYFVTKNGTRGGNARALPEAPDGKGSWYDDSALVTRFQGPLDEVAQRLRELETVLGYASPVHRILVARSVHSKVRTLIEANAAFDVGAFERHLSEVAATLAQLAESSRRRVA